MNEFEDIEQLLKPQCEFKASETLKQEVMEKALGNSSPSHRQDVALAGCRLRSGIHNDAAHAAQVGD